MTTAILNAQMELDDKLLLRLAREVAADIYPLETILKQYSIDTKSWQIISVNSRFQEYLKQAVVEWEGVSNTHDRVKLKAAAAMEEWLPELYRRLHDPAERNLLHKIKGGELLAKLAGMGLDKAAVDAPGEKFHVTINLGAGGPVVIEKQVNPQAITLDAEDYSG